MVPFLLLTSLSVPRSVLLQAWQEVRPSAGSAGGAEPVWGRVADGSSATYSSSRAARGECCPESLAGLFLAIRAPGRQFQMGGGKKRHITQNLHSSELTLETPKARLISIPAFSIQWKLFFPHNLCPVSTGCPETFQIQPASSSVALALAELEEFIVLRKLCCHGNSGTRNFNCKAQYIFMKIINKNANGLFLLY